MALNEGATPEMGLLKASLRLILMVEAADPLATVGPLPVIVDAVASTGPGVKVTNPGKEIAGDFTEILLDSDLVDFTWHKQSPLASLAVQLTFILFEPVTFRTGVKPTAGMPFCLIFTLAVMDSTPSALAVELFRLIMTV